MNSVEFTPDQQAAIASEANMVITACPGSGKTTIVVEKIAREVERLSSYQGVIAITFTVKSSKELKKRCRKKVVNTKFSFFGTIDHFCLSEIIYPFISRVYGAVETKLECKLFEDLADDLKAGLPDLSRPGCVLNVSDYDEYEPALKRLYEEGVILLESVGVLALKIILSSPSCARYLRSRYKSIFVDEYQDSSEPQHLLFIELLGQGLKAVAVGDIQQSIYAWRGSDPKLIQDLIEKDDVFEHHIVNINHRCHPSITNYANRLFFDNHPLLQADECRVYHFNLQGTQLDVASRLHKPINRLVSKGYASSFSEIAILVRNNRSIEFLKRNLTVPYRVYIDDPLTSINTWESTILNSLVSYYYQGGVLVSEILEVVDAKRTLSRSERKKARGLISSLKKANCEDLFDALVGVCEYLAGNKVADVEKQALDTTLKDSNLLSQYKPIAHNEVQIMTLHKSKGLEFDVVFHLDLYDWIFPRRVYTGNFSEEVFRDWGQDLNLHFVGVTRARNVCCLVSSSHRINAYDEVKNGRRSQFMELPGLAGLYISR